MFRKSKIEPVEKVKIVERYLAGEIGIQQAGKELGVEIGRASCRERV